MRPTPKGKGSVTVQVQVSARSAMMDEVDIVFTEGLRPPDPSLSRPEGLPNWKRNDFDTLGTI